MSNVSPIGPFGPYLKTRRRARRSGRYRNPVILAWRIARQNASETGCGFVLAYVHLAGLLALMRVILAVTRYPGLSSWWRSMEEYYGDD